ncbi:hypothetical protein A5810_002649 [Enterococcus faecium]|uniref:Uncharacterized protein n=1 Tax=Enterococcus faecium TaxID=1352 RepID=A0A242BB88_ENTFC|nr:hypothetical protein A5810_002649 [Enterococcus faecium]
MMNLLYNIGLREMKKENIIENKGKDLGSDQRSYL